MYASYLRQIYFDMPIHVLGVLCFKQNIFSDLISKTLIYICFMYIGFISIYIMPKSCFYIMFLYLDEFWTKRFSISKILVLEIRNLVFDKIFITQKEFKMFVTWFDFYSNKFIF